MARLTTPKTLALLAGLAALSACGEQGSGGVWLREAGTQLDSGEFGNANLQNMTAQVCNPNGSAYKSGKIGAPAADPVVVLDPSSTTANPIYRVHCTGRLDGKYARVIYRDYVASATPPLSIDAATAE